MSAFGQKRSLRHLLGCAERTGYHQCSIDQNIDHRDCSANEEQAIDDSSFLRSYQFESRLKPKRDRLVRATVKEIGEFCVRLSKHEHGYDSSHDENKSGKECGEEPCFDGIQCATIPNHDRLLWVITSLSVYNQVGGWFRPKAVTQSTPQRKSDTTNLADSCASYSSRRYTTSVYPSLAVVT